MSYTMQNYVYGNVPPIGAGSAKMPDAAKVTSLVKDEATATPTVKQKDSKRNLIERISSRLARLVVKLHGFIRRT